MTISTRGRYGVRALLAISKESEPISTAKVSEQENLSLSYLEQIFNKLKRAGLITATRGAHGGFKLAKSASEISVGDVIEVLDGKVKFSKCHNSDHQEECEKADYCVSRHFWGGLENDVNKKLYNTTLEDLKNMEEGLKEKAER